MLASLNFIGRAIVISTETNEVSEAEKSQKESGKTSTTSGENLTDLLSQQKYCKRQCRLFKGSVVLPCFFTEYLLCLLNFLTKYP